MCEPHFMPYDKLEQALLDTIIKTCKEYIKQVDTRVLSKEITIKNQKKNDNKEKINYLESKVKEYTSKIDMLYEDRFNGKISEATYLRISQETEKQLVRTQEELHNYKNVRTDNQKSKEKEEYEAKIRELINIEKPSRQLLQTLIEKIEIDKDKNIEIFYKFRK